MIRWLTWQAWRSIAWIELRDAVALAGLCLLGYGLWRVYEPAMYATLGALLLMAAAWGRK